MNIRDILMTYEPRPSAEVDQALKEISELLLECLPEKRNSSWFEQEFGIDSPVVTGYNLAVEDCEHHIKARLQ